MPNTKRVHGKPHRKSTLTSSISQQNQALTLNFWANLSRNGFTNAFKIEVIKM